MKFTIIGALIFGVVMCSCDQKKSEKKGNKDVSVERQVANSFQNKGHELVFQMVQKVGGYEKLQEKRDVVYTYTYQTPDGAIDISKEQYLFDGELSYGKYHRHERTLSNFKGDIEQGYDGNEFWLKHNGKLIQEKDALKRVAFNRPTNFYWFAMMQKLLDPGLIYEYLKETVIDGVAYEIVKVSFESDKEEPKDTYQLYINKNTLLVDQFLFTVVDYGKMEPFLMQVEYEKIEGILIPTKRKYKASNWSGEITRKPWIYVTWSQIEFDNGLSVEDFKK